MPVKLFFLLISCPEVNKFKTEYRPLLLQLFHLFSPLSEAHALRVEISFFVSIFNITDTKLIIHFWSTSDRKQMLLFLFYFLRASKWQCFQIRHITRIH